MANRIRAVSSRISRDRRGAALLLTLVTVVVLALLSMGGVLGALQDVRAGRNTLIEQRAFAVAEFGLNKEIADWDRSRNLPPPTGLAFGGIDSNSVFVAQNDTARVKVTRLNDNTFWVVSVGRASIGIGALESQRNTHMLVRIAYPTITPGGAIVTAGNLDVKGSAEITGVNTNPDGWDQCASIAGRDTFAISYAPGKTVRIQKEKDVVGGINADPMAADSNTYVRYGTESWNSLVANADWKIPGGTFSPEPAGTLTTCDYSVQSNWGEPNRIGLDVVLGCKDYFPIIYSSSSLALSKGRGQGILLVNGDLRINGDFKWYGLIIARDDVIKGNGTTDIYGSVMSRNANIQDASSILGNSYFKWSKCAVESALRGSAILTRTRERSWAQIYSK
jgi:hypothetical protein